VRHVHDSVTEQPVDRTEAEHLYKSACSICTAIKKSIIAGRSKRVPPPQNH